MSTESLSICPKPSEFWTKTKQDWSHLDNTIKPEEKGIATPTTSCSSVSNVSLASSESESKESPRRAYLRRRSSFAGLGNVDCNQNEHSRQIHKQNSLSNCQLIDTKSTELKVFRVTSFLKNIKFNN